MCSYLVAAPPIYADDYDDDFNQDISYDYVREDLPDWFDDDMAEPEDEDVHEMTPFPAGPPLHEWVLDEPAAYSPAVEEELVGVSEFFLQHIVVLALVGVVVAVALGLVTAAPTEQTLTAPSGGPDTNDEWLSKALGNIGGLLAPYDNYQITQGLHGQSYGHLAIDLAGGRGMPLKSPIAGIVTENYVDQYGNTTLVLENEQYRVTLLHGDYQIGLSETVKPGQVIGSESNHGYTMDMAGNLCYGRVNCGNHTHLNVFDKAAGRNIDPRQVMR